MVSFLFEWKTSTPSCGFLALSNLTSLCDLLAALSLRTSIKHSGDKCSVSIGEAKSRSSECGVESFLPASGGEPVRHPIGHLLQIIFHAGRGGEGKFRVSAFSKSRGNA
jgi:hypothetical protein